MKQALKAGLVAGGLIMAGCAPKPLYYWGEYEGLIYTMYNKPGSAEPDTQAVKLQEDLANAKAAGLKVPPGLHAHLGYMYFLQGNTQAALTEFSAEKVLFPESVTFIDGMIGRLKK